MTRPIESVCFDLDDTLFDYRRYARAGIEAAADRLHERTGREYHEELRAIYFDEGVTEGTFDELVERHDLSPELVDELVEAYHDSSEPLDPYPTTASLLSRLQEEYRLGLITDGRGGRAKLRRLGIDDHFDTVLVTPTVGRSKRDPAVFEHVLSELSARPNAAVYVGDDPRVDFRVPNEFGMRTVRLRRGRYVDLEPSDEDAAPDHEIEDLDELPALVAGDRPAERTSRSRERVEGTDVR